MAIKFSQFVVETSAATMSHIVGYNGADNIQITPENFFTSFATGSSTDISYFSGSSILKGDSTTPFVYIDDTNTGGQPVGRMGLGTSSPNFKLDIAGGDLRMESNNGIRFGGTGSNNTNWRIFTTGTSTGSLSIGNSSSTPYLTISKGSSTTGFVGIGTSSPGTTLDVVGTLASSGITQLGTGGSNVLLTSSGGGNVGIGTSSPGGKLHIHQTGSGTNNSIITEDDARKIFIGRDSIKSTDLSDNPAEIYIQQHGGNATFGNDVSMGGNLTLYTNARYLRTEDSAGTTIRILGINSSNTTYVGPIDTYAGGNIFYGVSAGVSNQVFYTGASERMRISSNGSVGINNTAPSSTYKLDIGGSIRSTTTSPSFVLQETDAGNQQYSMFGLGGEFFVRDITNNTYPFKIENNVPTSTLVLDSTGNVGIGTNSPTARLNVKASGSTVDQIAVTHSGNTVEIAQLGESANGNSAGALLLKNNGGVNKIYLDGAGSSYINGGNFGIGTVSPSKKLEVVGDIKTSGTGNTQVILESGGACVMDLINAQSEAYLRTTTAHDLHFRTTNLNRMVIKAAGNVGIGTTSPSHLLQLSGSGNVALAITSGTTNTAIINFGDSSNDDAGIIAYTNDAGGSDHMAFTVATSERMRITAAGNVLFGTTGIPNGTSVYGSGFIPESDDRATLFLATSRSTAAALIIFKNPNGTAGSISTSGSATAFNTSSDYRLKEDLQDFAGLDMVSKIPVYDFKWKTDESRSYGVMAHELQEVLPDGVTGEKDAEEMQGVDYSKIVPILIKSIQELKAEVEDLKSKI